MNSVSGTGQRTQSKKRALSTTSSLIELNLRSSFNPRIHKKKKSTPTRNVYVVPFFRIRHSIHVLFSRVQRLTCKEKSYQERVEKSIYLVIEMWNSLLRQKIG